MKVAAFYKILLLIFFLGFGRSTMDATGFPQGIDYGGDTDNHRNYGGILTTTPVLFNERNTELLSTPQLKSQPGLRGIYIDKDLCLSNRESFIPKYNGEYITVGLDSLAIIFPFHTFF